MTVRRPGVPVWCFVGPRELLLAHQPLDLSGKPGVFFNWRGMGWIVFDPATGSAGYFIAGSLASGTATSAGGSTGVAFAADMQAGKGVAIAARELAEAAQLFNEGAELATLGAIAIGTGIVTGNLIFEIVGAGAVVAGFAMMGTAVVIIRMFQDLVPPR